MQKVEFVLMPISDLANVDDSKVFELQQVCELIGGYGDALVVPAEFYSMADISGKSFFEYAYTVSSDAMNLLIEIVTKNKQVDIGYEILYANPEKKVNAFVTCEEKRDGIPKPIELKTVYSVKEITAVYRELLKSVQDYRTFYEWKNRCFPALLFTRDSFEKADSIGSLQSNYCDLVNCLNALNDYGNDIYQHNSEEQAISELASISKVACSGKGSNESETFKKRVWIRCKSETSGRKDLMISCIPHFKLDNSYSDKRLHFSWGRQELCSHSIIVVHVGPHWTKEEGRESWIDDVVLSEPH